jgi:hypothetical protein
MEKRKAMSQRAIGESQRAGETTGESQRTTGESQRAEETTGESYARPLLQLLDPQLLDPQLLQFLDPQNVGEPAVPDEELAVPDEELAVPDEGQPKKVVAYLSDTKKRTKYFNDNKRKLIDNLYTLGMKTGCYGILYLRKCEPFPIPALTG